jgi:hypothetical protein
MNSMYSRISIAIATLFLVSTGIHAATVFDNFGTDMSFDCCSGQGVGSISNQEIGFIFTPSSSGYLSNLYVAASTYSGTGEIIFTLYSDNAGEPGAVLEKFSLSGLPDYTTDFQPQHIIASGDTLLDSSRSYWLIASNPNAPDISVWNDAISGGSTVAFRDSTHTTWSVQPHERQSALRVEVSDINVTIDIKPGKDTENIINIKKDRNLNVAINHNIGFDATQVDPATVTFGPAKASPTKYQVRDVDHDGDADMLLTFIVKDTGIVCGTTSATLFGFTGSGVGIVGSDAVTVEPCP